MKKSPVISLLSLPSIFLTCSLLYALPGNGAPGAPKGVLVPVSEVTQGGGSVYCGNINNEWIPGRMLKGNRFYSFAAERSDSLIKAKSAIGKAKKRLLAKAQRLQARLQERIPACAGVGLSQPTMPKWYPKPTVTPTPKVTPSPTATPTPGVTPTGTLRPTPTPGPTATASPEPTATPITSPTTTPAFQVTMTLQDFDGTMVPSNEGGDSYPSIYTGEGSAGAVGINTTDAVEGDCLQADVTAGGLSLQFNPDDGTGRGFASDYVADPAAWQFNTYNRMSFWIKRPVAASPLITDGSHGSYVGTYVKQLEDADYYSDETGGNHYYHSINLPNGGHWTQVILNWHPDHYRGETAGEDPGCVPYPTAIDGPNGGTDPESSYNYFDTLTRFYIDDTADPTTGTYLVDEIRFYQEPYPENDDQVYSLTGTYDPTTNEVVVTWNRPPDENDVNHEVRYAFSDIHELGWAAATPAPEGIVSPPGWQGYNGMFYDTTALPLAGQPVVYIAIKPENSDLFSQIAVRLDLP